MTDISNDAYLARMAVVEAMSFIQAPSVLHRPRIFPDGDQWCALYGDNYGGHARLRSAKFGGRKTGDFPAFAQYVAEQMIAYRKGETL